MFSVARRWPRAGGGALGQPRRDRVRAEAERLLRSGVTGNVFPGAVAAISWRPSGSGAPDLVEACAGVREPGGKPVAEDTPYDLASLTKPVVATCALRLVGRGALALDTRAEQLLPDTRGTVGGAATLEALLSHRSGLAAWGGLYLDVPHEPGTPAARRWIVGEASRRADEGHAPRTLYSDLGYILVGEMVTRAAGADLAEVVRAEVGTPLGLKEAALFYPSALSPERRADLLKRVAATERDEWRGRLVRGEVHDENCFALGGMSGHAGLFGIARAVAIFGRAVLDAKLGRSSTFLRPDLVQQALTPRPGGSHRLGWDGKAAENSAAGRRTSPQTFGHLGFTGTSIFCDPEHDLVIVLLTNRVCPSRANEKIKGFRPAFHDGVVALFDGA